METCMEALSVRAEVSMIWGGQKIIHNYQGHSRIKLSYDLDQWQNLNIFGETKHTHTENHYPPRQQEGNIIGSVQLSVDDHS